VSERPITRTGGINNPSRIAVLFVLERWKASRSSGKRSSSRSAVGTKASVGPSACSGIFHCKQARRRQRMSGGCQGGERCQHAPKSARTQRSTTLSYARGDASFTRSSDSCRRSSLRTAGAILGGGAVAKASWLGKPAQAGGTGTGAYRSDERDSPRVTVSARGRA